MNDSEIVFAVKRVFKGRVPSSFSMQNVSLAGDRAPGFSRRLLKTGNELLVYAWRWKEVFGEGLGTSNCSHTALVGDASEDLKELGRGYLPTSNGR